MTIDFNCILTFRHSIFIIVMDILWNFHIINSPRPKRTNRAGGSTHILVGDEQKSHPNLKICESWIFWKPMIPQKHHSIECWCKMADKRRKIALKMVVFWNRHKILWIRVKIKPNHVLCIRKTWFEHLWSKCEIMV